MNIKKFILKFLRYIELENRYNIINNECNERKKISENLMNKLANSENEIADLKNQIEFTKNFYECENNTLVEKIESLSSKNNKNIKKERKSFEESIIDLKERFSINLKEFYDELAKLKQNYENSQNFNKELILQNQKLNEFNENLQSKFYEFENYKNLIKDEIKNIKYFTEKKLKEEKSSSRMKNKINETTYSVISKENLNEGYNMTVNI